MQAFQHRLRSPRTWLCFQNTSRAKMVWDHQSGLPPPHPERDQGSYSPSQDAESHQELGPHRAWPSSLEPQRQKASDGQNVSRTEGQEDPNTTCHPAPIPWPLHLYPLSIMLEMSMDGRRIQHAQPWYWPQSRRVIFPNWTITTLVSWYTSSPQLSTWTHPSTTTTDCCLWGRVLLYGPRLA